MGFGGIVVAPAGSVTSRAQERRLFVGNLLTLLGDTRMLWLPDGTDTTTSTDQSLNGRTLTADASMSLVSSGLGYYRTFNGTSQYLTTPDAANLSFGNGTADSPFSVIAVANVTDTAAARGIVGKWGSLGTTQEWLFRVESGDTLSLFIRDGTASAQPSRISNSAITQGSWSVLGATYTAATGGATAANDITLYQAGAVIASTATNSGSYVAMEDQTAEVAIGATNDHASSFFSGSIGLVAIAAKSLSASEHWAIAQLCRGYFNV